MADGLTGRIVGGDKLAKKLLKTPVDVDAALEKVFQDVAGDIRDEAKSRVPVGTGRLRDSITVKKRKKKNSVFRSVQTGTRRRLKIDPKEDNYYPAAVEYGSVPHNIPITYTDSQGRSQQRIIKHPGNKPRPFLRPALESNRAKFDQAVITALNKLIRK